MSLSPSSESLCPMQIEIWLEAYLANELQINADVLGRNLALCDVGLDSLDLLGLAVALEDAFGVTVNFNAVSLTLSASDLARHLAEC